jgi:hypothetical protein
MYEAGRIGMVFALVNTRGDQTISDTGIGTSVDALRTCAGSGGDSVVGICTLARCKDDTSI